MTINDCLKLQGTGINYIYDFACCGYIYCDIKLVPGEASKVVSKIILNDTCGTILEVNGVPYTNPLTPPLALIAGDDDSKITIKIEYCACQPVGSTYTSNIEIHESGGGGPTTLYFDWEVLSSVAFPINLTPIKWFPCVDDCNELQPEPIMIDNNSVIWLPIRLDIASCLVGTGEIIKWYLNGIEIDPVDNFVLPPNSTNNELTWTICNQSPNWNSCDVIDCFAGVEICAQYFVVDVEINPVTCGSCGLNCCDITLLTENNYLLPEIGLCTIASGQVYTKSAIGEKKILRLTYQYEYGLIGDDVDIYFNPFLFDITCNYAQKYPNGLINNPPPSGWYIQFQLAMIGMGPYQMTLFGAGVNANCQKNIQVNIQFVDEYRFIIDFEFYMIEDIENWIGTNVIPNNPKLLQSHISAPAQLQNLVQSVYNAVKSICTFVYIVDPNNLVEIPNTGDPNAVPPVPNQTEPYECYLIKNIPITSRFYNQGLYGGSPEFINHSFELYRNATLVPNFSTLAKTQIKFKVQNSLGSPIDNIVYWVIDANQFNDYDTFWNNYDSSRSQITTIGGVGVLDNHLQSPSNGPSLVGGYYECDAFMDINVNPSSQYYIIAIVYASGNQMVNSFISELIPVTTIPGTEICCSFDIVSKWFDYSSPIGTTCLAPTIKERIRNSISIGAGAFETCLKDYGWLPGFPDWKTFMSKVKLNVYRKVDNYPAAGQITWFMFNQYQSVRQNGFPGNWNNLNPELIVADSGAFILTQFDTRVRYESNQLVSASNVFVSNSSTPFNRNPAGALGSTYVSVNNISYDWAGEQIWFEYIYEIDLTSFFNAPCIVNFVSIHEANPIDAEPNTTPFPSWLDAPVIYGIKGSNPPVLLNSTFICGTDYDKLLIEINSNGTLPTMQGYLIGTIDKSTYGIGNLIESDGSYVSPTGLPQLSDPAITLITIPFINTGTFEIDLTQLSPGQYQICGIFVDDPATLTP